MSSLADTLTRQLRDFVIASGMTRVVVGLSGGVDSAVTLGIAVRALGAGSVTALILPQTGVSSDVSSSLARECAAVFGVEIMRIDIAPIIASFTASIAWPRDDIADMNIAPRVRMTLLYHFARSHDALVLGTSNRSECLLGYGTKWGDFAADVEVIGDCWKRDVYALARELGVPEDIIARPPTAELAVGHTDAGELGATYDVLDPILETIEKHNFTLPADADDLTKDIFVRVMANRHKTTPTPILRA